MKKIISLILVLSLFIPTYVKAETLLAPSASNVFVMEYSTQEVIYERNAHERKPMASMTKIMTMLLVMESIEKEIIKWEDIVVVSENASSMGGSQILLETNEKMSVYDLFKGLAVASGNDAAVALAEKVAGTEEIFVEMMNEKATELGLENTNFKNCHGLDEVNHYSSAYDMAMIAKELLQYEKVFEFTSIYEDYLRKDTDRAFWLVNTNRLVRYYDEVDGLKTGYTEEAGFCLTATALKNNMRIITVVMGEPDSQTRDSEVSQIFDYVFAQYDLNEIVNEHQIVDELELIKAKNQIVKIVPKESLNALYLKIEEKKESIYEVELFEIKTPTEVGETVGILKLIDNGNVINEIELTVQENVQKANIITLFSRYLSQVMR